MRRVKGEENFFVAAALLSAALQEGLLGGAELARLLGALLEEEQGLRRGAPKRRADAEEDLGAGPTASGGRAADAIEGAFGEGLACGWGGSPAEEAPWPETDGELLYRPAFADFAALGRRALALAARCRKSAQLSAYLRGGLGDAARLGAYRRSFERGVYALSVLTPRYPAPLRELSAPPPVIFLKGELAREAGDWYAHAVTLVGTRRASAYGEALSAQLGAALSRAGATLVSGLAYGIDALSQEAALKAGGRVAAVLASDPERVYPAAHAALCAEIARSGVALSELPPGARLKRHHFPARNRLMSALGRVCVVVEAAQRSGSLITVNQALDLGREVWAVPGSIYNPASRGCNALIAAGANVLYCPQDFIRTLRDAGVLPRAPRGAAQPAAPETENGLGLSGAAAEVLRCLAADVSAPEAIAARCARPLSEVYALLAELEARGAVRLALGRFVLTR